jgi:hypothetical protein
MEFIVTSVAKGITVAADWPAIRREFRDDAAVTMGELSGRLHDTCTARLATARTPGSCSSFASSFSR